MNGHKGTTRRRWTALAAVVAVLCASDARLAHLTFCKYISALAEARSNCTSGESCCPDGLALALASSATETCFVLGTCGCCSHAPPGHQGEQDARSPLTPDPLKVELGLALAWFPPSIDPPSLVNHSPISAARPFAMAPLSLLSNHLLI
jgi:hypothetical protein